tara:strand:+ start:48 stop:233 length:186 start_codon:yes stop_codon:yes gene_type:complete
VERFYNIIKKYDAIELLYFSQPHGVAFSMFVAGKTANGYRSNTDYNKVIDEVFKRYFTKSL